MISSAETPANQLRQLLTQLEISLGKIRISSKEELLNIPVLFDQTADLLDSLEDNGANLDSEYARFDTVSALFRKSGPGYFKALNGRNAYIELRENTLPDKGCWWWFLDDYLDNQWRIRQKGNLRSFIIFAGVIGILAVIYAIFLAPDKETREVLRYQGDAERALSDGDYENALVYLDQALAIRPEDDRLLILQGVTAQIVENDNLAEYSFIKAQQVIGDEVEFLATRAQVYIAAGLPEYALQDSEQALIINPESAISHYQKGLAANALGDAQTAYLSLEEAAKYANQEGKIELEGMARIQMAYLTQNFVYPLPTSTPGE
jgi:tetratricopeptide (TPR) repeat protein